MALVHENYIYHVNRRYNDSIFWKCTEYKKLNCKARVITTNKTIRKNWIEHNHPPKTEKIQKESYKIQGFTNSFPNM